jgi:type I restriction enzyme, R subunit
VTTGLSLAQPVTSANLLFDQFIEEAKQDQEVVERALANPLDNFELAMKPKVEGLMIDRMDQNQQIVNRNLNDADFQSAWR